VATERPTEEELRRRIEVERTELAAAVTDLRAGVEAKRRLAAAVAGILAAAMAVRTIRRLRRD
jgi:hypothetical protein